MVTSCCWRGLSQQSSRAALQQLAEFDLFLSLSSLPTFRRGAHTFLLPYQEPGSAAQQLQSPPNSPPRFWIFIIRSLTIQMRGDKR